MDNNKNQIFTVMVLLAIVFGFFGVSEAMWELYGFIWIVIAFTLALSKRSGTNFSYI